MTRKCAIKLENKMINIPAENSVSWGYLEGSRAQQTDIYIPVDIAKTIKKAEIELHLNETVFKKLYIISSSYYSESMRRIKISDIRYFWQFKNLTKKAYIYNQVKYAGIKKNFNNFNNASIAEYRYNSQTINSDTKLPYSAFEILIDIFSSEFDLQPRVDGYSDNKRIEDNQNFTGSSFVDTVKRLSELAGCSVYIDAEANIIISDAHDEEINETLEVSTISGRIEIDGDFLKPAKIRTSFIKEKEIEFSNNMTGEYLLSNVVPIPYNSSDFGQIGGEDYYAGSFIPINDLFEKIGITESEFLKRFGHGNGVYVALGVTQGLLKEYKGNFNKKDRVKIQLANLLFSSYRKFWRIPDAWLDRLLNLKSQMITVEDNFTQTRRPSEVRCDVCAKNAFFDPANKDAQVLINFPKGSDVSTVNASVNADLGIITLSMGNDPFGIYESRNFGTYGKTSFVRDFLSSYDARVEKPVMSTRFRFAVILSASEINDYIYYIDRDVDYAGKGEAGKNAKGEPLILEIFSTRVKAGYDKNETLVNEDILKAVANLNADLYSFSWKNKAIGMKQTDYNDSIKKLKGSLIKISHQLGSSVDKTHYFAIPRKEPVIDFSNLPSAFKQLYFNILGG